MRRRNENISIMKLWRLLEITRSRNCVSHSPAFVYQCQSYFCSIIIKRFRDKSTFFGFELFTFSAFHVIKSFLSSHSEKNIFFAPAKDREMLEHCTSKIELSFDVVSPNDEFQRTIGFVYGFPIRCKCQKSCWWLLMLNQSHYSKESIFVDSRDWCNLYCNGMFDWVVLWSWDGVSIYSVLLNSDEETSKTMISARDHRH